VIELYAITDDGGPPLPDVPSLHEVSSHGLAAVCAPAIDAPVTAEVLWRHEEVVEALMEDRDLLPVRYGTRLASETDAARTLAERHEQLAKALDRVRGCVELSLRVVGERAEAPRVADTGTDYMRAKGASAGAASRVHEPLARLARASVTRRVGEGAELLRAAYLVDREAVEAFAEHVADLQSANPELQLLCTGPWPPYSFADDR
jgi:Gas vesicle synthesis protein GvpL/GvpF